MIFLSFADNPLSVVEFARIYLAAFYTFVALFYTALIFVKKRSDNIEVVFPGDRFCTTWWNHLVFRIFRAAIWMICLARVFVPDVDNWLGMIPALNVWPVVSAGLVLLTIGFCFTVAVHAYLGRHWRSGIDPGGPQMLKTDGLYRHSRNPMFLGVALAQLGFFMALPSLFSLVCLGIGLYTLYLQTLAEEIHLQQVFASTYKSYQSRVPRWL